MLKENVFRDLIKQEDLYSTMTIDNERFLLEVEKQKNHLYWLGCLTKSRKRILEMLKGVQVELQSAVVQKAGPRVPHWAQCVETGEV